MSKSVVVTFPQLQSTVEELKRKYAVALEEVDPSHILYLKSDSKSQRAPAARITPIKVPHPSVTPFRFALTVYPKFDEVDEARQVLYVLRELLRIEDFEASKIGKYPLQDFHEIVEKYGTTWEEKDDLENPLKEKKLGA